MSKFDEIPFDEAVQLLIREVLSGESYEDEPISTAKPKQCRKSDVPLPLQQARALERQSPGAWKSRERIFLQQAKLLENYEDDCTNYQVGDIYYPTYQSLSNQQLRGYFGWRGAVRRGTAISAPDAYYELYMYELINQIGVENPMDGYRKLVSLRDHYVQNSGNTTLRRNINRMLRDYVLYYALPAELLQTAQDAERDQSLNVLGEIPQHSDKEIAEALQVLAGGWLNRSRFYREHREDMDAVMVGTVRGIFDHYDKGRTRSMIEQFYGEPIRRYIGLFEGAVFLGKPVRKSRTIPLSATRSYQCANGNWYIKEYADWEQSNSKLTNVIRTIDCRMRQQYKDKYPIQQVLSTKWLIKLIDTQILNLFTQKQEKAKRKKAAEQKKLHLDYSKLDDIRRDAAITRERLTVEDEELPEFEQVPTPISAPETVSPEAAAAEALSSDASPLTPQETRFLQCLLRGERTAWLREEGKLPAVMADSINEKLFDRFQDTVLTVEDCPTVVEDYADDLKEMVHG